MRFSVLNANPGTLLNCYIYPLPNARGWQVDLDCPFKMLPVSEPESIFDPFSYSSLGESVFTGLELAIARQIVQLHGWKLALQAPKAGRSRFVLDLLAGPPSA
ncbi:MAG: sensor histidine kinase [Anaerolineae bacterium]|nr:sensor histidine kinase [Anaerolineae bacterium]